MFQKITKELKNLQQRFKANYSHGDEEEKSNSRIGKKKF